MKQFKRYKKGFLLLLVTCCLLQVNLTSCKKLIGFSKENLAFSLDTLVFDTVFTTIGSTTQEFKIYNRSNKTVKIEEIQLMGGSDSPFRINVDGLSGTSMKDLELEGKDSLFAFVDVKLKVNNATNPMVIEDSIRFRSNGKDQYLILAVWGQDMYYHYSNFKKNIFDFNNDMTWPNDKPHLIYGAAVVDSAKTLTIQQDTKIYLHKNAMLFCYKGTLRIEGAKDHEVQFLGDRLESEFDDAKGQYYGIYFHEARPSTITYANIKNGTAGIHVTGFDQTFGGSQFTVVAKNCKIYNNQFYGVMTYAGGKFKAENCMIAQNGMYGVFVYGGSDTDLNHCDVLGYGKQEDKNVALLVLNYYDDQVENVRYVINNTKLTIKNTAIYGSQGTELRFDTIRAGSAANNFVFSIKNCLIKRSTPATESYYGTGIKWNLDPEFVNIEKNDYHLKAASPLINAGSVSSVTSDIEGKAHSGLPDIGCYEY